MTNKDLRRRETDKFGPYVQQVALDHANKRIAELESKSNDLIMDKLDLSVDLISLKNSLSYAQDLLVCAEQERDLLRQRLDSAEPVAYLRRFEDLKVDGFTTASLEKDWCHVYPVYALPPTADKKGE